jgi:hypothetical protein
LLAAAATLIVAVLGCANLPALDVCGNGVLDEGEDCDGQEATAPGGTCGASNQQRACRFTCDVRDPKQVCPAGYACSATDGICRAPAATFALAASLPLGAIRFDLSDLDGDGQNDLLAVVESYDGNPSAYFFADQGATSTVVPLPPLDFMGTGRLTSTVNSDLLAFLPTSDQVVGPKMPTKQQGGLLVLEGAGRAFSPAAFSSFPIDAATMVLPLYAEGGGRHFLLAANGKKLLGFSIDSGNPAGFAKLDNLPQLPFARVGTSSPVVAFGYEKSVQIYVPEWQQMLSAAATISIPNGAGSVQNFWLQDIDNDGIDDVAIVTSQYRLYVAYGDAGPGSNFHTSTDPTPMTTLVAGAAPTPPDSPTIIGVIDLDGDGTPEVVTSTGVYVGKCTGTPCVWDGFEKQPTQFPGSPDSAVFADFNGDGRPDVLAGSSYLHDLQFVLTVGHGIFNTSTIPTTGPTSNFVVGDFDGDLFPDVAFAEQLTSDTSQIDFVFGGVSAEPTGPLVRGPFGPVSQLVASTHILSGAASERSDLLAVTGKGNDKTVALFPGSARREFFSPYYFVSSTADTAKILGPKTAAIGNFDGTDPRGDIACLTTGKANQGSLLWLLASQKSGTITAAKAETPTPSDFLPTSQLVVVPGTGGAADRVALFGSQAGQGALVLGTPSSNGFELETVATFTGTLDSSCIMEDVFAPGVELPQRPICVADLDGDGQLDVAVIATTCKGAITLGTDILVFWGDGHGSFEKRPVNVTPPGGAKDVPSWLTCVRAHATEEKQLAVVTGSAVTVMGCHGRSCSYDDKPILEVFSSSPNGFYPPLKSARDLSSVTAIIAGDVTGDGIDDLIVSGYASTASKTLVLTGNPTLK